MHWTVPQTKKNVHITGGTPLPHTARAAGPTRRQAVLAAAAVACWPLALRAGEDARAPLRFGILPIGGMVDSRTGWEPLLDELMQALGRPIHMFSATSYAGLGEAVRRGEVDLAFLSGKMALDAVTQHDMRAIAQVTRHDGLPGYRALLLAREGGHAGDVALHGVQVDHGGRGVDVGHRLADQGLQGAGVGCIQGVHRIQVVYQIAFRWWFHRGWCRRRCRCYFPDAAHQPNLPGSVPAASKAGG